MRLRPTIATMALATQAIASPDFEVKPNDEIRLQPEKTDGIPYHHQIPEKGQRQPYENEDIKLDGWRRGFSELKESKRTPLKTFEKRKGGGGGFGGGRSFGGGGRSFGSSLSSIGKSGGLFSGSGRNGGLPSSPGSRSGSRIPSFGTGAAAGGAIGYIAGNHHGSSSFSSPIHSEPPCPRDCRCDSMNTNRLYFTVSSSLSEGKNITISIKTNWHLNYDHELKTRLEKEAGLISIPDPRQKCGWHVMQDIRKNAVHRGLVEYNIDTNKTANTPISTTTITASLQTKIPAILKSTYPTLEIGLILGFTLTVFFLAAFCCCGGIALCRNIVRKRRNKKEARGFRTCVPVQNGMEDGVRGYGQP